ncbi:MAG: tetratricopeptide repeat protein [Chthoniobacter sp.]
MQVLVAGVAMAIGATSVSAADPDKDPQMRSLLKDARSLIDSRNPVAAIEQCDKVTAAFKAAYDGDKRKIYCARTSEESMLLLLQAAADKKDAVALSSVWSDAYFLKSYALQDLGRIDDAQAAIRLALALSPFSSHYLSEQGSIYLLMKDWPQALLSFQLAEEQAPLGPAVSKGEEIGRARRGQGFVFVELGKLDEAEKKYQQCLATDPKDARAARELKYVQGLKAKRNSSPK